MPDIFESSPGTVAVISDQKVIPGRIKVVDPAFPVSDPSAVLISGIEINQETSQEFKQSLDGSVFIYVFGDSMGSITIQGVVFPKLCDVSKSGLADILEYYTANRASVRATPVIVEAGGETLSGFLTRMTVRSNQSAEDPTALVNNYTMVLSALPKK